MKTKQIIERIKEMAKNKELPEMNQEVIKRLDLIKNPEKEISTIIEAIYQLGVEDQKLNKVWFITKNLV